MLACKVKEAYVIRMLLESKTLKHLMRGMAMLIPAVAGMPTTRLSKRQNQSEGPKATANRLHNGELKPINKL